MQEDGAPFIKGRRSIEASSAQELAEKVGVSGKLWGKRFFGAEALVDSAGFMRGLKPPPPSALSFSAAC
jgi:hypothetical protein